MIDVLLVEDSDDDVMFIEQALAKTGPRARLARVPSGEEALVYLRAAGGQASAPRPALVLLDWSLPGIGGEEVLRSIRADPRLARVPVVVLTSSSSDRDVQAAYGAGANAFLTKPVGLDALDRLAASLVDFWLGHCRLPAAE